jgi:hypothetical protein
MSPISANSLAAFGGVTYALIKSGFAAKRAELKAGVEPWTRITSPPLRPLCLVKAIAGMVVALNADVDAGFRERHKPLADCLLDRNAPLPEPYRAYLAIHDGSYATFAPTMYRGDPAGPDAIAFSAIEQPPFAYILTFDEREPDAKPFLPCGGLRDYGRLPYGAVGKLEIDLLIGFRDTPVPGFYGQRMDAAESADTPREP